MEHLFYSHDEKITFWVAGYTDNSLQVDDIIEMLIKFKAEFIELCGEEPKEIRSEVITTSRRYKLMRVFWAKMDTVPDGAFVIGEGENKWTMHQWITN